ncbi:terpene synthase family protein [Actinomadura rudentiformis]|uniref:Terpene synthase n=1 Tax=Actinomadura rudentiformis TaxID=359158 RepID=A0A6H9YZM8_9ACTN|nr:terpene synthase family protein [Actinomadura rudentiformis]KAB2346909.1 terpene cyclase [Actinomadura rudentiformis]
MPQKVRFEIPFAPHVSPFRDWARERNVEWLAASGLTASEEGRERYRLWNLADAAARIYHAADPDALAETLNFFSIGFLFDDQFDPDMPGRLPRVARTAAEMAVVPFRPVGASVEFVCPVTEAWAALWQRIAARTPATWQERFAAHFAQWLTAHVWEVRLTAEGYIPELDGYIRLRRQSVGLDHSYDIAEWTYGFEMPAAAAAHPLFRELRVAATDTIAFMNDIHSYERETSRHEAHNLVIVLHQRCGLSREEAVARAAEMTREALARFMTLESNVPEAYEELRLDDVQRDSADRFLDGVKDWIRGNHDWAINSGRYKTFAPDSSAYTEDILSPGFQAGVPGMESTSRA